MNSGHRRKAKGLAAMFDDIEPSGDRAFGAIDLEPFSISLNRRTALSLCFCRICATPSVSIWLQNTLNRKAPHRANSQSSMFRMAER
jgi:hypothetical protein